MDISSLVYQNLKWVVPLNRSELLWLNTHEFLPAKPVPGAACRALTAEDMQRLARIKDFDIDQELADNFDALGLVSIGIFIEKKLVGLSLFTANDVAPTYSQPDGRFNGLKLNLPAGTRYLLKAIVLPEYRGQRLHSAVVRFAIDHLGKDTVNTIVTTHDIANKAFLASSLDQGFERVGKFTEFRLLGKSVYRLPKPINSVTGEKTDEEDDGGIVLSKAA